MPSPLPTSPHERDLTNREREILRDSIVLYILSGEPVSSRSLAKRGRHGLSAASIRNTLADLEDLGYLTHPHTSAGRTPTRTGYHLFVEGLMDRPGLAVEERRYIDDRLRGDADEMISEASHLLTELSQQVGIVVTPSLSDTVLRTIDFVPISGTRVLSVVVSTNGFADHKVIETERPLPREELVRISNYLNENFAGRTLGEIRARLLTLMAEERAQVDRLLSTTLEMARQGFDVPGGPEVLVDGTTAVLAQPELSDVQRVRRLIETFADKARLVSLLSQVVEGKGVRVVIGEDSALTSDLDFSLVATRYGVGDRSLGTLAIFGPSRMEYQRIVPLVHYLGETLSRALAAVDES